jgi:putative flavoprotein involved in K+ transport
MDGEGEVEVEIGIEAGDSVEHALTEDKIRASVVGWLEDFERELGSGDPDAVADLFLEDAWWRDLLAVSWDLRTWHRRPHIVQALGEGGVRAAISGASVPAGILPRLVPIGPGEFWIEALFDFETPDGHGRGVVRLKHDDADGSLRAWTLLTTLQEIRGHEEPVGDRRPEGAVHRPTLDREVWQETRRDQQEFVGRDPTVLIVGAGQSGLSLAARLRHLGVPALVIDKNERVGDNWRNRYRTLVLHDTVWLDHLPYLPFPESWPVFTPKDKLGDWFEFYASALELNVWTSTELTASSYDQGAARWTATVRRADGSERTIRPTHLVMATGASGGPRIPDVPGMEDFEGEVFHSSAFRSAEPFAGRKAIVVGAGNTAHDIAQDFAEQGAEVTLIQRSSTYVFNLDNLRELAFAGAYNEGGLPTEDDDLLAAAFPFELSAQVAGPMLNLVAEQDREMLDGLARAGYKAEYGEDGGGPVMRYLTRAGGYYADVGCAELICNGQVKVRQGVSVDHFRPTGLTLTDGSDLDADVVVLATGYEAIGETARRLLGDEVADRCGPVWGLDDEGEVRGTWRRSGQPGLWFMAGNLNLVRFYSRFLALQILATELGLANQKGSR